MEYTTELEELDEDTWHPSLLRHQPARRCPTSGAPSNPMNEFVSKQMFNDPDKSGFVAPPV